MTKEQLKMAETLACVCGHPKRLEIVRLLTAGPESGASATMFHNAGLGPIQTLAYHMREMRKAKVLKVKRTAKGRRGAPETFCVLTDEGRGAYHAFINAKPLSNGAAKEE